ncbi:MAG TPA: cation transporter [Geminicoccus sp.]|uniref:heavy-metal-associated domain-containing protein n=1 Tax=Geminicoccus sp. TaxID=2024832 RepID=UPI002BE93220|nr:cation transporter [Geminicoccus sp.]HWL71434.1 cation transporter [Geminicoccus sp.]
MRLKVEGMSCAHCVRAVTEAVRRLDPQAEVTVSVEEGTVEVKGIEDRAAVTSAIEAAGYEVREG